MKHKKDKNTIREYKTVKVLLLYTQFRIKYGNHAPLLGKCVYSENICLDEHRQISAS